MTGAREGIVDDLGQAFVRAAPSAWGGGLVEHGGKQRVREADDPVPELDHVVRESRLEGVGVELIGRQSTVRAREQQRSTRLAGQPIEPSADERVQRFRHGQRLSGVDLPSEGTAELESEKRIATRGFVETQQRGACEHSAEPRLQDRLQRAGTERADMQALDQARVWCELELGDRTAGTEPAGEHEPDVLALQSPQRERQHARRRRVEPLDVVDRDHDRLALGEQLQRAANSHRKGAEVDRLVRLVLKEQGGLERATPRGCQSVPYVRERVLQKVAQPRIRHPELDLGRPGGKDAEPPLARGFDTREPERRLPDSRLTLEHERSHPSRGRRVEEGSQQAQLVVPAQDIHAGHLLQRRA